MSEEKNIYERIFIHQGTDQLVDIGYKMDIRNISYGNKPDGGLWASTYTPNQKFLSHWDKFNTNNIVKGRGTGHVLFKLTPEARILELDKLDKYGKKYVDEQYLTDVQEIEEKLNSKDIKDVIEYDMLLMRYFAAKFDSGKNLKWKEILEDFDGVYLPTSEISHFSAWDVESICMFNLKNIEVTGSKSYITGKVRGL